MKHSLRRPNAGPDGLPREAHQGQNTPDTQSAHLRTGPGPGPQIDHITVSFHLIDMTQTWTTRQGPLPDGMRSLLRDYPRDAWPDHPNFAASIRNWMGAHQGFRQLATIVRQETETFLDKASDAPEYTARLGYFGNMLVRNLHGHHSWEDRNFFPELAAADPRFEPGLQVLEADHQALDTVLDRLTRAGNRAIQLGQLDETQMHDDAGQVHAAALDIESLLNRHLADEEDLAVPILLHHKLRG